MGVRNSKYGPGVILENNGTVTQMGSCCNPYFASQFKTNNQSCFVNPTRINMFKTERIGMNNFSCEIPRKLNLPPTNSSPSVFSKPLINNYFNKPYLKTSNIKSFYQQPTINLNTQIITSSTKTIPSLTFKTPQISYQSKLFRPPFQLSQMSNNNILNTNKQIVTASQLTTIPINYNQISLPKPNQITLTNNQGNLKFPLPLAYPYGQPCIENFNSDNTLESFRNKIETIERVNINEPLINVINLDD